MREGYKGRARGALGQLLGAAVLVVSTAAIAQSTRQAVTLVGSNTTAASAACNGDPNTSCNPSFEPNTGAAYNSTITTTAGSYTFDDWRDVLRVLLTGLDHDHAGTDATTWAARDCSSPVREALANNWANLFENQCTSPAGDASGPCTALRHVFRTDDFSPVTQTLVALLGLPSIVAPETTVNGALQHTGASPFCNAVRPAFVFPTPPTCLQGTDATWDATSKATVQTCAGQSAVGAGSVLTRETAVYRAVFQDNDPIRRKCVGSGAGTAAAEDVCGHSGDLGLVLSIADVPEETLNPPRTNDDRYNATPCNGRSAGAVSVGAPEVFDAITQARVLARAGGNLLCPNGDVLNNFGGCLAPTTLPIPPATLPSPTVQCLASRLSIPALTISSTAVPAVNPVLPSIADGRAYNQHLYVQLGSAGGYQTNALGFPITGAYYRLHALHSLAPTDAGAPPSCQFANSSDQIGCLVAASPCSVGVADVSTLTTNAATTGGLKLSAQSPISACIDGGPYPAVKVECQTSDGGSDACMPETAAQACGANNCGTAPDGLGGFVNCGSCTAPNVCSASQGAGVCGACQPIPIGQACQNHTCGTAPDGCGGTYSCGACGGLDCRFCPDSTGGTAGICECVPLNNCGWNNCGFAPDGCGCGLPCGTCPAGQVCNTGGGTAGVCGTACVPLSVQAACGANNCGTAPDGCGGTVSCGACVPGIPCSAPSGAGTCGCFTPKQACGVNDCGSAPDNCGGTVSCGTCSSGSCSATSGPGICVGGCQPTPKAQACLKFQCGTAPDGCGGTYNCGTCGTGITCEICPNSTGGACGCLALTPAQACGSNNCGSTDLGCSCGPVSCGTCPASQNCSIRQGAPNTAGVCTSCVLKTAQAACGSNNCGTAPDGCGGFESCGTCNEPANCYLTPGTVAGTCCTPLTQAAACGTNNCGLAPDGCGGLIDCGSFTCRSPNKCSSSTGPGTCGP
jgi:hypothetical protein